MPLHPSMAVYKVENATKVIDALAKYLRGDYERFVELCAPEVVWRSIAMPEHAPFGGTYHGPSGVRDFFARIFAHVRIADITDIDVIPSGDDVVQTLRLHIVSHDGQFRDAPVCVGRWTFRHGQVVAYTDYFDVGGTLHVSGQTGGSGLPVTRDPSFDVYKPENAYLVLDILSAYQRGDIEPLLAHVSANIELQSMVDREHARFGGVYCGSTELRDYFRRLGETFVLIEYDVTAVIPAGDEVVHVAKIVARRPDKPTERLYATLVVFWRFEAGRIIALREYFDMSSLRAQFKDV